MYRIRGMLVAQVALCHLFEMFSVLCTCDETSHVTCEYTFTNYTLGILTSICEFVIRLFMRLY